MYSFVITLSVSCPTLLSVDGVPEVFRVGKKTITLLLVLFHRRIDYFPGMSTLASQVKVTLRLTVGQYVLVSSPNLGYMTRIFFSLKVTVLSFWGALSDERSGLSCVSRRK
jgi:hypothetical protein